MNDLLVGVLSALLATNQPAAISNLLVQKTGIPVAVPSQSAHPLDQELAKIMEMDDQARSEIDDLIRANSSVAESGKGLPKLSLQEQIEKKLKPVRKAYEDFVEKHPKHPKARLAYAAFLMEIQEEQTGYEQMLRAKELDPTEPSVWNNLANYYGHNGPVTNAFIYYAKAIELNPRESTYFHNLATTMFVFRTEATNYFRKTIPQVLDDAMAFYQKALELDPTNFLLATDLAQCYYGFPKINGQYSKGTIDASLKAWKHALTLARDDIERQGVLIHLARINANDHRISESRTYLTQVTNIMFTETKNLISKKLDQLQNPAKSATAPDGKTQK